eukprot:TRINITY_DN3715_c0_g1_i1.p1 TRINITY_DN3715_c0_g1~~TRINITY_DN3715_c0_g1_i1.p1  ORF type:complete len:544 (-),score=172.88 TRINITY_DN3715_c0_g1_i1:53-1684(-)
MAGAKKQSSKVRRNFDDEKNVDRSLPLEAKNTIEIHENVPHAVEKPTIEELFDEHVSFLQICFIYIAYIIMIFAGGVKECKERLQVKLGWRVSPLGNRSGYANQFKSLDIFWLRRVYQRLRDLFERPICSKPGAYIDVMMRASNDEFQSFEFTGETRKCLNLCSYNYLGFAQNSGAVIDEVEESIRKLSFASAAPRMEGGNHSVVMELEKLVADYVGKPASLVIGMGYATNSTVLPALANGKGNLIISDSLNHASIVCGSRDSGARIRVFKHNNPADLELVLKDSILNGQPRTRIPWSRIFVLVEGVYSMEGEILRLPEIIKVVKKYKAYLYVDEAHSIGALGKTGRGVCEHWGVDPNDIDVLMGTFTKAFGSVGGYIAGSHEMINYLRSVSYGSVYSTSMSPPCAQMALSALRLILGLDGSDEGKRRLASLNFNANYFRKRLTDMGFHVIGDHDSPIVPMMVYHPAKMSYMSRELLDRGITIVVVGFPVTTLFMSRIRFCISAAHTKEDLDWALDQINEVGSRALLNYGVNVKPKKRSNKSH